MLTTSEVHNLEDALNKVVSDFAMKNNVLVKLTSTFQGENVVLYEVHPQGNLPEHQFKQLGLELNAVAHGRFGLTKETFVWFVKVF